VTRSDQTNSYSANWFEYFHIGIDEARTSREIDFVLSCVPLSEFQNVWDVCCGTGRHARALSKRGYVVTGIDRDTSAIEKARQLGSAGNYIIADVRDHQPAPEAFDAVIVMGQSFGHFDEATNRDVLRRLAHAVRNGGRIVLDLWNSEFFKAHQGERDLETSQGIVCESKRFEDGRLFVELNYPDGTREKFEWQLFTPQEMERLAKAVGLRVLISCSGFDSKKLPTPGDPRIQFVLERS
jgi:SAM-dependent methyltransferase